MKSTMAVSRDHPLPTTLRGGGPEEMLKNAYYHERNALDTHNHRHSLIFLDVSKLFPSLCHSWRVSQFAFLAYSQTRFLHLFLDVARTTFLSASTLENFITGHTRERSNCADARNVHDTGTPRVREVKYIQTFKIMKKMSIDVFVMRPEQKKRFYPIFFVAQLNRLWKDTKPWRNFVNPKTTESLFSCQIFIPRTIEMKYEKTESKFAKFCEPRETFPRQDKFCPSLSFSLSVYRTPVVFYEIFALCAMNGEYIQW